MSKLLVSDYDGTYKTSEDSLISNNIKLKEFMEDEEFMISTGRNYEEFFDELEKYCFFANYYSMMDGNILFDSNLNILNINTMPRTFIDTFKNFFPFFESIEMINAFGEKANIDIVEYKIVYRNIEAKKKFINFLLEKKIYNYHHNNSEPLVCHISNPYGNKIDTIKKVSILDDISKKDIYTIGDGYNDVGMLKEFNGYAMSSAKQDIKDVAKGEYDSVASLAEDIRRRRV